MSDTTATASYALQEVSSYPHGAVSWAALDAVDLNAAKSFYAELFGWTYEDIPMGDSEFYTIASLHGKPVAGMGQKRAEQIASGEDPYWWVNITVDDVDRVAAQVAALGGTDLTEPMDVFDQGRMTMILDPGGALVGLWQAKSFAGGAYVAGEGVPVWFELYTHDVPAATAFYQKLLGWRCDMSDYEGKGYAACHNGEQPVAMIMPHIEEMGFTRTGWVVYFGVTDVEAGAQRIRELGGEILYGPTVMSGYPFAHARDPQGATFLIVGKPQA